MLEVGEDLPDFSVLDENGNAFSKKDLLGSYGVIFFYPKDSTPGCTKEACDFSSDITKFTKKGIAVYGMSKDSPSSHQKFIGKHNLKMKLLSDESTKALKAFKVWAPKKMFGKEYFGIVRSTLIVNPLGKVAHVFPKVAVIGHSKKVLKVLDALLAA